MPNVIDIETCSLSEFTEKAYLDYSMYVILDRALPNIADGLKPVQRRIIYAMSELGLKSTAKPKKSARTIGDVLGKFHPHGDSACYEAMVLMAQPFSYRYPLIDGQGNFGSSDDPKSFAAMRYTEARLSPYAQALLNELGQGTTEWVPNFDGTLREPSLLPAELPNVLLNGASGIAVGMATDIPPHNAHEVIEACVLLLNNPKATLEELVEVVRAPDYPTQAEIITPAHEIAQMYRTGHGSVRARAVYLIEDDEIVVTSLPYQVSGNKVMEQIAAQMLEKKLPMVADLRDESDHENPTRLVITPKSNRVDKDALMSHLFASTDLERSYRVNLNMIGLDGRPQVKNLKVILSEWLEYRLSTVEKRLQHRLDQVQARLHILAGLLIAYLNIDEVIRIIREADQPKQALMKKFKLTELQADAILEIKLRQLAKLEEQKIKAEQDELAKEQAEIESILGSKTKLKNLVAKELKAQQKLHGDKRRSPLVKREEARILREEDRTPAESITVVLSQKGWIRSAKGHEVEGSGFNYHAGDTFLMQAKGRNLDPVILFDEGGKSYTVAGNSLPSARGLGEPLTSRLKTTDVFNAVLMGDLNQNYLLGGTSGYGFVTPLSNLVSKNRGGKAVLKVSDGGKALAPQLIENLNKQYLAAVTTDNRLLVFPLADLPILPRGKGNKIIQLSKSDAEQCVAMAVISDNSTLHLFAGKRTLSLSPKEWRNFQGERAKRGQRLPKGFGRIENMVAENK